MKVYVVKDYDAMSAKAASIIASQVILKSNSVLGLATGSTPIGLYDDLVKRYEKGELDFSDITTVNLDEYKGLPADNDQSYRYFMNHHLFDRVNIDKNRTFLPDGTEPDAAKECKRYTEVVAAQGGVDLQLLGMGHNGHIAFNEPADYFTGDVQCIDLTESTIEANKRFFASADDVPKQAYSMGIKTIMMAKKILVVVSGEDKAEALKAAINGEITPRVPASILQLHHDVTYVVDEAAASKM